MNIKFFNPGLEFKKNKEEYLNEWLRVREAGDLILRKDVEDFERNLAKFVGTKYAIALNSGTDALLIALKAIGIKEGDKVLVPSHTFVATAQVVQQLGAEVVLYDMNGIKEAETGIKAIMVAHIAGEFGLQMREILQLAKNNGWEVIEDACQALGATQNGKKAGSFGKVGAFSFYPAKILGGPGDGGALVTDDEEIYKFVLDYRNHWKSDYSKWGINSRMDNVIAAELNLKLARIDKTLARRKEIADIYIEELPGDILPQNSEGRVWQDFIIRCIDNDQREKLYVFLKEMGVETMRNEYPFPIQKLPQSVEYEKNTLRLPIYEIITDAEVEYVIDCINKFYSYEENQTIY